MTLHYRDRIVVGRPDRHQTDLGDLVRQCVGADDEHPGTRVQPAREHTGTGLGTGDDELCRGIEAETAQMFGNVLGGATGIVRDEVLLLRTTRQCFDCTGNGVLACIDGAVEVEQQYVVGVAQQRH